MCKNIWVWGTVYGVMATSSIADTLRLGYMSPSFYHLMLQGKEENVS